MPARRIKLSTALFVLALLILNAPGASAADLQGRQAKCITRNVQNLAHVPSEAYQEVEKLIQTDFKDWAMGTPGSRSTVWPVYDSRPVEQSRSDLARASLQKLTQKERIALESEMHSRLPDPSRIPTAFAVMLNPKNEETWLRLFDATTLKTPATNNLTNNFMLNTLSYIGPYVHEMPAATRERLLDLIAERYLDAKKGTSNGYTLGPKRSLDAWLKVLIPNDEVFNSAYKKTKNPLKAYQKYLDVIKSKVIGRMSAGADRKNSYGQIKADDILAFGKVVTDFLNEPAVIRYLREKNFDPKQARIYFHGSILKGLGKKESDLDNMYRGLPEEIYDFHGDRPDFESLRDRLANLAHERFPKLELNFGETPHRFQNGPIQALEPFFIESSASGVKLQVLYPRNDEGFFASGRFWNTDLDCDTLVNCQEYILYKKKK